MATKNTPQNKYVQELIDELARREADKLALVKEFEKATNPTEAGAIARQAIKDMLPQAILTAKDLMLNSPSDGVKAGISKFVMLTALDPTKLEDETDTSIRNLLKELGAVTTVDKSRSAQHAK